MVATGLPFWPQQTPQSLVTPLKWLTQWNISGEECCETSFHATLTLTLQLILDILSLSGTPPFVKPIVSNHKDLWTNSPLHPHHQIQASPLPSGHRSLFLCFGHRSLFL